MAKQITDQSALTTADATDLVLVRDISAGADKKTTVAGLATAVAANLPNGSVSSSALATGTTRLGISKVNTDIIVANTYTTYATVTATSRGGECEAHFEAFVSNGVSGADRTLLAKVRCDGVDVTPIDMSQYLHNVSGVATTYSMSFTVSSTPSAGSHTWTLQLSASAASAVVLKQAVLRVEEVI